MQHAAVGGAKAVFTAAAAEVGKGSFGRSRLVGDIDVLGARVRPASTTVAHGHAVVEAQEVAASNRVQEEIVPAKGLAGILAPELGMETQRLVQRAVGVGVPVDEQNDPRRVHIRSRLGLDPRAVRKGHVKRGRVAGVGLRDQVAGVERVGRQAVELAEEIAKRRFHSGHVRAVPEHPQHGLALVAGRRPPHGGHEDAPNAACAVKVGQGHRPVPRQALMRQDAVRDETLGQGQAGEYPCEILPPAAYMGLEGSVFLILGPLLPLPAGKRAPSDRNVVYRSLASASVVRAQAG